MTDEILDKYIGDYTAADWQQAEAIAKVLRCKGKIVELRYALMGYNINGLIGAYRDCAQPLQRLHNNYRHFYHRPKKLMYLLHYYSEQLDIKFFWQFKLRYLLNAYGHSDSDILSAMTIADLQQ